MSECIEFGRMQTARNMREDHAGHICPVDDDARTKTVCFVSDTPVSVLEEARSIALAEEAEAAEESLNAVELTRSERDDLDFSRDGVNIPKARYLKGLGERMGIGPFEHVDLAEIDGVTDAEPILARAKRTGGTGRGGGTNPDDEAAERRQRERRKQADAVRGKECNHAEGACMVGDPDACEFLGDVCGLSDDEVGEIMGSEADREPADRDGPTEADAADQAEAGDYDELPGPQRGAIGRAWNGYHGAVADLRDAVAAADEALENAQQAAAAINGIHADAGMEMVHLRNLERAQAALLDLVRKGAEMCEECHADHGQHGHDLSGGPREDIRRFVREGGAATPVGIQDDVGEPDVCGELPEDAAAMPPESMSMDDGGPTLPDVSDGELAEREPERPDSDDRDDPPRPPKEEATG